MADGEKKPNSANFFVAQIAAMANGAGSAIRSYEQVTAGYSSGQVWLGQRFQPKKETRYSPAADWSKMRNVGPSHLLGSTPDAAINLPFTWSEKKRQEMYKRAGDATGQPITNIVDFLGVWRQAVGLAGQSWAATEGGKNGNPLTPYDIFDLLKREGAGAGNSLARTTVSHSKSVEKLSEGSTWAILEDAATRALGRAPTHSELRNFAAKANTIAVKNPTRTTTTTRTNDMGQVVSSSSTTQQGASMGDYQLAAKDQAATPEAGAYQAATTYFNAFTNALSSPV